MLLASVLGVVLLAGSSSSRFLVWKSLKKEHPPGGEGGLRSNSYAFYSQSHWVLQARAFNGGPEPLEKENHEFLGSKRDEQFSNPFFETVPKTCQGLFFVPALA